MRMRALLCLVFLITISGCGYKDIDKRLFVVSIGIDQIEDEDEQYMVYLKMAIPSSEAREIANEALIVSEKGKTVAEAVRLIKTKVDKELDFGHAKMIVIGEEAAKAGAIDLLDWFVRRRDIQKIALLGIGKPDAKTVLELSPKSERIPSNALFLAFENEGTESAYITTEYLFNFRRDLYERGIDPVLPIIEKRKEHFEINKLTIFQEGKKSINLTTDETKTFNVMKKEVSKVSVTVSEEDLNFVVTIEGINTSFELETDGIKKPVIHFTAEFEGTIEESLDPLSEEKLEEYGRLAEQESKRRIEELFKKLQEAGVDPMGFGLRYRATHFGDEEEKWKKWQEIYPDVEFKIEVKTKIKGTGVIDY